MNKRKTVKMTAYVRPGPLRMLAVMADSAGLNYALGAFASVLAKRGRELAGKISPEQWEVLRDVLDEDCWELPGEDMSWLEVLTFRVEDGTSTSVHFGGEDGGGRKGAAKTLLEIVGECDELDALAILTAVRHCEQSGSTPPANGVGWWEPSARLSRRVLPAVPVEEEPEPPKRKRKK